MSISTLEKDLGLSSHENHEASNELERPLFDAERAVSDYADQGIDTRSDVEEHARQTESLVRAFAGNVMPEEAIRLSLVHDVFDRFWHTEGPKYASDRAELAKAVLLDMFTDPEREFSYKQVEYSTCLLHDMVEVEKASGEHRRMMAQESSEDDEVVSMLSDKYQGEIPPEVWKTTEPYIMFSYMREFLWKTNIESLVVKACELIDNMREPSSLRESALLQDVLEAESFYAPILEVIGFDGLASVLRGEAHRIRLTKRGLGHFVETAEQEVQKIEQIGIDRIAADVFGPWYAGEHAYSVDEDALTGKVPVVVGDGKITTSSGDAEIKFRIKTTGSLADKLVQYEGEMPKDLVGFTVVSKDIEASASNFADFIVQRMPELTASCAKSKKQPYYIYGSMECMTKTRAILEERGVDMDNCQFVVEADEDIQKNGRRKLHVAKATLLTNDNVPVEVQFLTEHERKESRVGEVAHIIYKYLTKYGARMEAEEKATMVAEAVEVLRELHRRKEYLNPHSLEANERSRLGGEQVRHSLTM